MSEPREASATQPAVAAAAAAPREIVVALLVLTFTTGIVDAVSLLELGPLFVANQTGNVVLLGFAIAGVGGFTVVATLISLASFLAGIGIGGLIGRDRRSGATGWMRLELTIEIALLAAAALLAIGVDPGAGDEARRYAAIALLAAAMGNRNVAVRDLAVANLATTTVVSMTMTGLLADSERFRGARGTNLVRRGGAVAAMLAGALAGALLARHTDAAVPLAVATACVIAGLALIGRVTATRR